MRRSPLLPIFLTVFVDVLGFTLLLPLLPFYAQHFGATTLIATTLTSCYAVCQLLSGPFLGRISDRVGRKPTLLVSQIGTFCGFLLIGWANSLWMLFVGRIIDGLTAGNLVIAQAYISDVTRPEERTRAYGLIGISFGSGFILGPVISGLLISRFGFSAPAFGAAALSLTSIVLTATLLPSVKPVADPASRADAPPAEQGSGPSAKASEGGLAAFRRYFEQPTPRNRLLTFFAFSLSFSTLIGGLAFYLERRFEFGPQQVGYVYAFSALVGAPTQRWLGRLVARFGEARLVLFGLTGMSVGYGLLGAAYTLPMLLLFIAVSGVGQSLVRPSITTLLTKSVGRTEQGALLGVSQSLTSLAQIAGPPVAGWLIGRQWLAAYGLIAGGFALGGVLLGLPTAPSGEPAKS
jgi:MFS transporter, DHA1 family, tetracycline resistance protein